MQHQKSVTSDVWSLFSFVFVHKGSGSGPQPPPVTPGTPNHTPQSTYSPDKTHFGPNICDGHFDSIAILRGEMFVFKVVVFNVHRESLTLSLMWF